jgi:hypothetical protein
LIFISMMGLTAYFCCAATINGRSHSPAHSTDNVTADRGTDKDSFTFLLLALFIV